MQVDVERSQWETADSNARKALRAIREFIDYLENMKRELCLESARLSSDETIKFIGPGTEVAVTGIVHAINYLAVCRTRIQETDLVLTTRFLARLKAERLADPCAPDREGCSFAA
jgi:hypothetical protein